MSPSPCRRFRTIWFRIRWFYYRKISKIRNTVKHYLISTSVIGGKQEPVRKVDLVQYVATLTPCSQRTTLYAYEVLAQIGMNYHIHKWTISFPREFNLNHRFSKGRQFFCPCAFELKERTTSFSMFVCTKYQVLCLLSDLLTLLFQIHFDPVYCHTFSHLVMRFALTLNISTVTKRILCLVPSDDTVANRTFYLWDV